MISKFANSTELFSVATNNSAVLPFAISKYSFFQEYFRAIYGDEEFAKQPERERNHTVYATNHVIKIPSFGDVDNHISGNWAPTSPGMSKTMSVKVDDIVSGLGENSAANAKIMKQTLNETFSE